MNRLEKEQNFYHVQKQQLEWRRGRGDELCTETDNRLSEA